MRLWKTQIPHACRKDAHPVRPFKKVSNASFAPQKTWIHTQPAKIRDPSPKHRIFGRDCILSVHILKTRGASPCFAPPDVFEISKITRWFYGSARMHLTYVAIWRGQTTFIIHIQIADADCMISNYHRVVSEHVLHIGVNALNSCSSDTCCMYCVHIFVFIFTFSVIVWSTRLLLCKC